MKQQILDNALEHLNQEPKMKQLIEEFGKPDFNGVNDNFNALLFMLGAFIVIKYIGVWQHTARTTHDIYALPHTRNG